MHTAYVVALVGRFRIASVDIGVAHELIQTIRIGIASFLISIAPSNKEISSFKKFFVILMMIIVVVMIMRSCTITGCNEAVVLTNLRDDGGL